MNMPALIGSAASTIAAVVLLAWYAKSKNRGHLFMAIAAIVAAVSLGIAAVL